MNGKSKTRFLFGLFIILSFALIEYSAATGENLQILEYPAEVLNNGTEFLIIGNAQNFSFGGYALMLNILNSSNNTIGQVFDPATNEWSSSYYYLYNYLTIASNDTNFSIRARINPDKNYNGSGTLQLKLKDSSSRVYLSSIYSIWVLNAITANNQTNGTNSTNQTNEESSIELLDYPEDAEFGETIEIEFHVYRGNTGKYAVYAYLEDSDGEKVSSTAKVHAGNSSSAGKFKDYYFKNVEIDLKCLSDSGDYDLVIYGLDIEEREEISITACEEETSTTTQTTGESTKIEYYILNQESAKIGDTIQTNVKIVNNEDKENVFSVWSYVYRASKCYSCLDTREENAREIIIPENSEAEILLENSVEGANDGNYSLKVKILKGGLKTPKEFTFPIYLYGSFLEQDIQENIISGSIMENFDENGNYIEINSKKSVLLDSLPYIISSIVLLFCVFILVKKI